MNKKPHKRPGLPILAKYARGDVEAMKYWSQFIENDAESLAAVDVLKRLYRLFETVETAPVIPGCKPLAEEIFVSHQANRSRSGENIANLYYDSKAIPIREGFRPSLMSERRLKYAGEGGIIELSVIPVFPGRFEVTGRLESDRSKAPASVSIQGRQSLRTNTDEFGFFSFAAVNPGTYRLRFKSNDEEIVINNLRLS
jgi:hypothetical protein